MPQVITDRLLELAGDGHVEELSRHISALTFPGPGRRERVRTVLAELTRVTADAVRANAGLDDDADSDDPDSAGVDSMVRVVVYDLDGSAVDVDEISPPVRALLRAMLAELANHPQDAALQLDLALDHAVELEILFAYALAWAIELTEWSNAPHES